MNSIPRSLLVISTMVASQLTNLSASEKLITDDFHVVAKKAAELSRKHGGTEHVLLVFDVDNTLLATNQELGSDQWFNWQDGLLDDKPLPAEAVASDFQGLLRVYSVVLSLSAQRPTQPDLPLILNDLAEQKFPTVVLTSRGTELRDATRRELLANGFRLDLTGLQPGFPGPFQPYCANTIEQSGLSREEAGQFLGDDEGGPGALKSPRPVSYSEGLYLTAGQHKGAMLRMLLDRSNKTFGAIVFVDDHKHNVDRVFNAFKDTQTEVITYLYGREDANVEKFVKGKKKRVIRQWERIRGTINKSLRAPRIPAKATGKQSP